jgi:Zn-dependent protease
MNDSRTVLIPPGYGRITFGKVELLNLLAAVGALTLAFSIFMFNSGFAPGLEGVSRILFAFGSSLVAVVTGFVLHELAHKVLAQKMGAWAEFRAYPLGLMLAVIVSLLGAIFAAPGAVYIQGTISRKQNGLISIAGPLTNIAIGVTFLMVGIWLNVGLIAIALYWIGWINIILAAFNMLPIPPFDGYKVLKWNLPIYIATTAAAGVMALLVYTGAIFDLL